MSDRLSDARAKGRMAFEKGYLSGPYRVATQHFKEWQLGYNQEYYAHLELVKSEEAKGYQNTVSPGHFNRLKRQQERKAA